MRSKGTHEQAIHKTKITVAVIAAVLLATALFGLPLASQLSRIGKVRDQYRLDDAVHSEVIADPVHKPTAERVVDAKVEADSRHSPRA